MTDFMPIIDTHHHIWRLDRTPWLNGPIAPRIFGDYTNIRRDYPISEYFEDVSTHGVVKSVYVQVNVAPGDEIWEAGWATQQGQPFGLCQAAVAFCDLNSPDAGDVLDKLIASGPVRGIRQQLHWHEMPLYSFARRPDLCLDPNWQEGLKELERRQLHFELQIFPSQYRDALTVVDRRPGLNFVLLHAGMPEDRSAEGHKFWSDGLRAFAERPNVVTKLSALGTFSHRCDVNLWSPIIHQTVDIFGPRRCMFGSNFPIEKLWTDYASLVAAVRTALTSYSHDEQADILGQNAARFYRI